VTYCLLSPKVIYKQVITCLKKAALCPKYIKLPSITKKEIHTYLVKQDGGGGVKVFGMKKCFPPSEKQKKILGENLTQY
jgi:hypothetical protein